MVDKDQKLMDGYCKALDFDKAKNIYMKGGHSGPKAKITVGTALAAELPASAEVKQGTTAIGKIYKGPVTAGGTKFTVSYASTCKEGGLPPADQDTSGCFTVAGGDITVGGTSIGAATAVTNNYRTLMGFSTGAYDKMATFKIYDHYYQYYNKQGDYAHQRVMAGLDKTGICKDCDDKARAELAKKTSAYMNVWMYVVREFEDAIEDCKMDCINCNDDPVHAWDEGVAFYSGSLEGVDGSGSGAMIWNLADKRCTDFKTCSSGTSGTSKVNSALLKEFSSGRDMLLQSKCKEATPVKDRIIQLMSIPLVQGSLRYAYKVGVLNLRSDGKAFAEGAAFSAAILPRVHACNAADAKTIADNMNIELGWAEGQGMKDHAAVKKAFENNYACMGITCEDVGGLWEADDYYAGAGPCGTSTTVADTASPTDGTTASAGVDLKPTLTLVALLLAPVVLLNRA
jgi:hypothetical protein